MGVFDFTEDLIKITEFKLAGKLPNPFVFDDGTAVTDPAQWPARKAEIWEKAVTLQFGQMPPKPEFLEVEPIYLSAKGKPNSYRITTGRREKPISFTMVLFKTDTKEKAPVVVDGDLCFPYAFDKEFLSTFLDNGINFCAFNRCELAADVSIHTTKALFEGSFEKTRALEIIEKEQDHVCTGPLKDVYPEFSFGAIGAWAWGYSRCVDALEILENVDTDLIAFTGHSRGGKTAILAGVCDERAKIVNPNEACAGGCSCYRLENKAITEDGDEKPSEPISNIMRCFPTWMGAGIKPYIGREQDLPFDSHDLKALVAPRVLLVGEAASDIWAGPVGSWQTSEAAKEVYKFLGCENNLLWYFRKGYHYHKIEDLEQLVNVIKHLQCGEPLNEHYYKLPFKPTEPIFDWKCP